MTHPGTDHWQTVARGGSVELAALLGRCQEREQHHDPDGRILPRAKRHDGKTSLRSASSPTNATLPSPTRSLITSRLPS